VKSPEEIVQLMLQKDAFSKWMNVIVRDISLGNCTLEMKVSSDMLNGFEILHGGLSYSLCDSALAFAANSYGYKCVSIETSISHLKPVGPEDTLQAQPTELHRGRSIGVYEVTVSNQLNEKVALFKGTVHISKEIW
jgi:acyl-CoA thioesterase